MIRVVLIGTWLYWVSLGQYWLVIGGTGSVQGGTGWYVMVMGQYWAAMVGIWWQWVSIAWYWLVLCGTGLIMGFYACIYIEKINGDVNQPTDQKGECSAICLFESKKIEKRQRFAFSHTIVLIVSGQRRQTESFLSPTELSSSLSQLPLPF